MWWLYLLSGFIGVCVGGWLVCVLKVGAIDDIRLKQAKECEACKNRFIEEGKEIIGGFEHVN